MSFTARRSHAPSVRATGTWLRASTITRVLSHFGRGTFLSLGVTSSELGRKAKRLGSSFPNPKIVLGMLLRLEGDFDSSRSALEDGLRMSARRGDRVALAHTHIGFACLAADLAEWHRAAELHGVAQALIDQIGRPWLDHFEKLRDDSMDKVRENLGEDAFHSFYEKGMRLSLEEATALALGRSEM